MCDRPKHGVHWQLDVIESLKLGEAVAISVLWDQCACHNEEFAGILPDEVRGMLATV